MKHFVFGGIAALIAGVITTCGYYFGAHDAEGVYVILSGYPGLLATAALKNGNVALFTVVNWLFYFLH